MSMTPTRQLKVLGMTPSEIMGAIPIRLHRAQSRQHAAQRSKGFCCSYSMEDLPPFWQFR
eukprot:9287876-Karenia_brevis.AAC.1